MDNILITSAGQRVSLVRLFQKTARELELKSKVYTVDLNPRMAPACYVSDGSFEVCRCDQEEYIDKLIKICKDKKIGIVIPTIDTELLNLAENKTQFLDNGINVLVSDADFIKLCRDKRKTAILFSKLNIDQPRQLDKYHPRFPMFAKPYDGSLSANTHVIREQSDLTHEIMSDPKLIFMDYVDKDVFKEFTVDMYYGKDSHLKCLVPRERIKIREGEINKGITRKNFIVDYLRQRMEYMPGVVGTICIQLFYDGDKQVYGIEINPRFGGGYPLSYYAGANFAKFIFQEYVLGENIIYSEDWKGNTLMLRYDDEIIVQL